MACEDDKAEVAYILVDHGARVDILNNVSHIFIWHDTK